MTFTPDFTHVHVFPASLRLSQVKPRSCEGVAQENLGGAGCGLPSLWLFLPRDPEQETLLGFIAARTSVVEADLLS